MDFSLRAATSADADAIARLHAASWQSAYRGIVPDVFLDADLVGERTAYWEQKMRGLSGREFVILAERAANQSDSALCSTGPSAAMTRSSTTCTCGPTGRDTASAAP
jgi:hypothetical protein